MLTDRKPPLRVSVIVPARNEEANIADCVRSLLAPGQDVEILVAEDGSEDATAEIVRQLAAAYPQVKLIAVPAVPEGWLGKPPALAVGAEPARGRWLLFTDADTRHAPGRLAEVIDHRCRSRVGSI